VLAGDTYKDASAMAAMTGVKRMVSSWKLVQPGFEREAAGKVPDMERARSCGVDQAV
jgi:hypothetical protein